MARGHLTERELVALLERWKDELVRAISDYNTSLSSINKAVTNLDDQKNKWYTKYWWAISIVSVLLVLIVAMFAFQRSSICSLTLGSDQFNLDIRKNGCSH
ncbi:MAG: hypothetical protein JWL85_964 [Candidatus Saccharibacteria bacterium]|nr:hypothetical protein [Candidatus Saccharibacteria bacterium]